MDYRLPIPRNWQDFESICHRLWAEVWNDLNSQKNGRQGQPQNGVDIFGKPIYTDNYHGVQCKDKDNRLGSILTEKELNNECKKATNFQPSLATYTLATTSQRDEGIQEFCRTLNTDRQYPFEVNVWSWDDIEAEIAYRPAIFNHYYPNVAVPEASSMNIKLNRHSTKDHLYAFFSRPILKDSLSQNFKSYLLPLLYELTDNAYNHGKATLYEIKIDKNKIELIDNGIAFNPTSELDASKTTRKGNVGSFVFYTFSQKFKSQIKIQYRREKDLNQLVLTLNEEILQLDDTNYFEVDIDLRQAYGRENAKVLAKSIKTDKENLIVTLNKLENFSVFVAFVDATLDTLTGEQTVTFSLPRHEYLAEMANWFNDKRLIIKTR
jgi:hypothetical protein